MLKIRDLFIYPVKSLGGIRVDSARLTDRGLQHDRRWMLVDDTNRFLSQREFAQMALLMPDVTDKGLLISNKNSKDSFLIPFLPQTNESLSVTIWNDQVTAQLVIPEADLWFSKQLNVSCKLVYMPDTTLRKVDREYAYDDEVTSFSDAYPIMMIGQTSLDDLNSRLDQPLPMNRFRPNIVFDGGLPYEEDEMEHFKIGVVDFYGVKLCARCNIPAIDQDTLEKSKEPSRTLSQYRQRNNKIYFGQNVLYHGEEVIKVGDVIEVVKRKATPFA
jgi:hypothetical protein